MVVAITSSPTPKVHSPLLAVAVARAHHDFLKKGPLGIKYYITANCTLDSNLKRSAYKGAACHFTSHTQNHTYLGVEMTPTMNWSFQLDKMLAKVTERGDLLNDSMISVRQKLDFIHS